MNRRLITILLCAFVVAAVCSLLVYRVMGVRISATQKPSTSRVVAASADVKLGSILTAADLATIEIAGALPAGAILKPEDAVGRGVVSDIYKGEPLLEARLAARGSGGGLAATIPKGMRACAVKVDDVVGVAGFVTPGMRVDVLIAGNPPNQPNPRDGTEVKTLLQNIGVLSAGTDIQKDTEGKAHPVQVVNLLVTPEQAEILSLASSQTHIQLVLRNPLDTQISQIRGTALGSLFGEESQAPAKQQSRSAATRPRKRTPAAESVEILNGSQRTVQKFQTGQE